VAARLKEEDGVEVEILRGGFGELSVSVDGRKVVNANRFRNPMPDSFLQQVRAALVQEG